MSRKPPTDTFTRFTSTTPSFSSKPSNTSFNSSQPQQPPQQPPTSSPSNETPAQRVARLRSAHEAKQAASLSQTDRVLSRGRRVADILHRTTTYSLLGFSALATILAAYGLVSLVSHNRTQKRAWIEREMDKLDNARRAFLAGNASAEQLHLLEQERAGEEIKLKYEADKRRKKEAGYFASVKNMFGGKSGDMGAEGAEGRTLKERGMDLEEQMAKLAETGRDEVQALSQEVITQAQRFRKGDKEPELRPAAVAESGVAGVGLDAQGRPVPMGKMQQVPGNATASSTFVAGDSSILQAVQRETRGGQLDQLAQNISTGGSSWFGSLFGGSRS